MGGLFAKPKAPALPPVIPPPALEVTGDDAALSAASAAKKRAGFAKTIITGDLDSLATGKKKLLG